MRVAVPALGEGLGAETEDLGPGGCLLVSSRRLDPGLRLRLSIEGERIEERISLLGRVAWAGAAARPRAGVAFEPRQPGSVRPETWFENLLAAQPAIAARLRQAPRRLALDAPLFLLPPPRAGPALAADEVALLRLVDNGVTPQALLSAHPERAAAITRALFSLFEKGALTLSLGQSVPPWRWKEALSRLGADRLDEGLVVALEPPPAPPGHEGFEALRSRPPGLPPERPGTPPVLDRLAPVPAPGARPAPPPPREVPAPRAAAEPGPASGRQATGRPPQAQRCLDLARLEASKGNLHAAIALLRRGLALSPRDPEISALLGTLVFDRGH